MNRAILLLGLIVAAAVAGCGDANSSAQTQPPAPANDGASAEYIAPDAKGVKTMTVSETAIPGISGSSRAHRSGPNPRGPRVRSGGRPDHGDARAPVGPS